MNEEVAKTLDEALIDAADIGLVVIDAAGIVLRWNRWMEDATALPAAEALGRSLYESFPELRHSRFGGALGDAQAGMPAFLSHKLNRGLFRLHQRDGRPMMVNVLMRPLAFRGELRVMIQVVDATASAEREAALRASREARYRAIVDTSADAIVTTDVDGRIQWMNRAAEASFGWSSTEATGQPINLLLDEPGAWSEAAGRPAGEPIETAARRSDGTELIVEITVSSWISDERQFLTGILRDATDRIHARDEIESALRQKEVLLREVNHRVKNSLQLVSDLLAIQGSTTLDQGVRHSFEDARARIRAIAQVHERLYRTEQFQTVEFAAYLKALCEDVVTASGGPSVCDVQLAAQRAEMQIDQAVPLGLIANELVTNAIKHGPGGKARVAVSFLVRGPRFELIVSDEGPGLPPGFELDKMSGLGMRLVKSLASQVGGTLELMPSTTGTVFRITGEFSADAEHQASG